VLTGRPIEAEAFMHGTWTGMDVAEDQLKKIVAARVPAQRTAGSAS
jgi:hypothetical protein